MKIGEDDIFEFDIHLENGCCKSHESTDDHFSFDTAGMMPMSKSVKKFHDPEEESFSFDTDNPAQEKGGIQKKIEEKKATQAALTGSQAHPDSMKFNYDVAGNLLKFSLSPEKSSKLENITAQELIITPPGYDRIQEVFDSAKLPYTTYSHKVNLTPDKILFVNCPGTSISQAGNLIREFVKEGGYLVTTDWAISNIVDKLFPNKARRDPFDSIPQEFLPVMERTKNSYTEGMFLPGEKANWWIEPASYPIQILGGDVSELLASPSPKPRPVAITFPYGKGRVFHALSHFYLQKSKEKVGAMPESYLHTKFGMKAEDIDKVKSIYGAVDLGPALSAYSSLRFVSNIILDKYRT